MPLKITNQQTVIKFINKSLIYRFGLLESILTKQGTIFIGEEMKKFAKKHGFKLLYSIPYYKEENSKAKAINKSLILNI